MSCTSAIKIITFWLAISALSCSPELPPDIVRIENNTGLKCGVNNSKGTIDELSKDDCECIKGRDSIVQALGRNGSSAVLLNDVFHYGFFINLLVEEGEYYEVSAWKKANNDKSFIVATNENPKILWKRSNSNEEEYKWPKEVDNGWVKMQMSITIPPDMDGKIMAIYVWNPKKDTVLLDDFEIKRKNKRYPDFDLVSEPLRIQLGESKIRKLEKVRKRAFENGILEVKETDWVKGILFSEGDMNKIKLRLKGDWLDHLIGKKWSFRLSTKANYAWKGMRSFSLHTPSSRGFLEEWVAHQLFEQEDVLTTRYGFIPVKLNDQNLGIYAYEEHFDKQLVEAKKRREGPILKLSEDAFWGLKRYEKKGENYSLPFYQTAVIKPFKVKRTLSTPLLKNQFLLGQNLVSQHVHDLRPVSEIYDIDKLAKYYALCDVLNARHGLTWHNERFYYNPVSSKLEPVAFDCYGGGLNLTFWTSKEIFGNYFRESSQIFIESSMMTHTFKDPEFLKIYAYYLEIYSNRRFIADFYASIWTRLKKYENLIRMEYKSYQIDTAYIAMRAGNIRRDLPNFKRYVDSVATTVGLSKQTEKVNYDLKTKKEFLTLFLNAYVRDSTGDSLLLYLENYFTQPVSIVGAGSNDWYIADVIRTTSNQLTPFGNNTPGTQSFHVSKNTKYLFCLLSGDDEPLAIPIYPWPKPTNFNPRQSIKEKYDVRNSEQFYIQNKVVRVKEKSVVLQDPIYIPHGFTFQLSKGEQLDMKSSAFMLIEGSVAFNGTANDQIVIRSSDASSMGMTVLNASDQCEMKFVHFEALGALNYEGWVQTGAVNFYESDVSISHCTFSDNSCEDALNIIRSEFSMTNTHFKNTYGDAFDSDFSIGTLDHCEFVKIGNDAIDLSGSKIDASNCKIEHAGDKAVSAGEKSSVRVENMLINQVEIAFASKDESKLNVNNSNVNNATFGIVVFQKKPEFGAAEAIINQLFTKHIETELLVEKGSAIYLDGKKISGTRLNVGDQFY